MHPVQQVPKLVPPTLHWQCRLCNGYVERLKNGQERLSIVLKRTVVFSQFTLNTGDRIIIINIDKEKNLAMSKGNTLLCDSEVTIESLVDMQSLLAKKQDVKR